jgi:hypothetical protein
MIPDVAVEPITCSVALANIAIGVGCVGLLRVPGKKVLGVHPALKPMKFAFSIASFLFAMALVLPLVDVPDAVRRGLAWVLGGTMAVEMLAIGTQAVRGVPSHFNVSDEVGRALWSTMAFAIALTTLAVLGLAIAATAHPLRWSDGSTVDSLLTAGVRAGLWPFLFVAMTGASMAGRRQHSVGGADGGPGLPVVNWSRTHGDLRVPHFLGLHAMHVFPVAALVLRVLPLAAWAQAALLASVIAGWLLLTIRALQRAFRGRPAGVRPS